MFIFIHDVEDPELSDTISPGFGVVSLKFFDVVTPKRLILELRVDERSKLAPEERGVSRRQLIEALCKFFGFEYAELRQTSHAWPLRRGGHF